MKNITLNKRLLYAALKSQARYRQGEYSTGNDEYNLFHFKTTMTHAAFIRAVAYSVKGLLPETITKRELDEYLKNQGEYNITWV